LKPEQQANKLSLLNESSSFPILPQTDGRARFLPRLVDCTSIMLASHEFWQSTVFGIFMTKNGQSIAKERVVQTQGFQRGMESGCRLAIFARSFEKIVTAGLTPGGSPGNSRRPPRTRA
jgi:hypothetical protein